MNIQLSAAMLFTGSNVAKSLRMIQNLGIKTIQKDTYQRHATNLLYDVIEEDWESNQNILKEELPENLHLAADGRADSPGIL